MKVCILGAGALGSAIGGTLAQNGVDVYLVDQWQAHVDNINKNGLIFVTDGQESAIKVTATTDAKTLPEMDIVVVLVKSFATRTAVENAMNLVGEHTVVMSLQNGLGNEEIIEEIVGSNRIIGGKAYVGGVLIEPGKIIPGIVGKDISIGEMNGELTERIQKFAKMFNDGGITTHLNQNITGMIWDKLLVNVAAGALAGVTGLPYGDLYQIPEIEWAGLAAIQEGVDVAKANGVKLSIEDPKEVWRITAAGLPYEFKTSMLQSLEKNQATEIDFINGAVVRWGEKSGIPTPVNKTLVACVKGKEDWIEKYNK